MQAATGGGASREEAEALAAAALERQFDKADFKRMEVRMQGKTRNMPGKMRNARQNAEQNAPARLREYGSWHKQQPPACEPTAHMQQTLVEYQ